MGKGHEVFDDGDIVDDNRTTMCKRLEEEYYNKKVKKVDIQKKDSNDASWRFNGILVQAFPGGKTQYRYTILFAVLTNIFALGIIVDIFILNYRCLRNVFSRTSSQGFRNRWM